MKAPQPGIKTVHRLAGGTSNDIMVTKIVLQPDGLYLAEGKTSDTAMPFSVIYWPEKNVWYEWTSKASTPQHTIDEIRHKYALMEEQLNDRRRITDAR